jgi:hypothetical protein
MSTAEDILRRIEPLVSNIPLHSDCHILTLSFVIPEPIRNPISSRHHSLASLVNTSLFGVISNLGNGCGDSFLSIPSCEHSAAHNFLGIILEQ